MTKKKPRCAPTTMAKRPSSDARKPTRPKRRMGTVEFSLCVPSGVCARTRVSDRNSAALLVIGGVLGAGVTYIATRK